MDQPLLDLYTDDLLSSFGSITATGLSTLLDDAISHDKITRFLSSDRRSSADSWKRVKPLVRTIENPDGVLIIDDSIEEKPYTDENDIMAWHDDHSKDRNVKGINFMTVLYNAKGVSIPVAFELIAKTEKVVDPKTGKQRRRSKKAKNEYYRECFRSVCSKINSPSPMYSMTSGSPPPRT